MTDTTNYYVCTKCGKACGVCVTTIPGSGAVSQCCLAPVRWTRIWVPKYGPFPAYCPQHQRR